LSRQEANDHRFDAFTLAQPLKIDQSFGVWKWHINSRKKFRNPIDKIKIYFMMVLIEINFQRRPIIICISARPYCEEMKCDDQQT
jgi:hypothetical protein